MKKFNVKEWEDSKTHLGHPTLNELIDILKELRSDHGDKSVYGCYDGFDSPISLLIWEDKFFIGSIS